jgi:PHP family Zn ribbon phosphoesterase
MYVTPPFTELKSLNEVVRAQRKGATTKTVQTVIKKYFKNVYNFPIFIL